MSRMIQQLCWRPQVLLQAPQPLVPVHAPPDQSAVCPLSRGARAELSACGAAGLHHTLDRCSALYA